MKIEMWSDFACPYCYLGKTRLDKVLKKLDLNNVEVIYKTFQLDPTATRKKPEDYIKYAGEKYGSYENVKQRVIEIKKAGKVVNIKYNFDDLIINNTTLAHKILKISKQFGKEKLLLDRLFFEHFEAGKDLGDLETLLIEVEKVGLGREIIENELKLKGEKYQEEIDKDYKEAISLGVRGVPFFVIDDKYSISGARSEEDFKATLRVANMK